MSKTFSVQDVASLNKRIEQLNVEGTRTETRISMLTEQLATGLREYESQYGVNLSGKTLKKTAELIKKEYETILSAISKEYELKSRIVEAIQRSDIDEANRLLGIAQDAPEEEPEVAVKQEVPKAANAPQISPVVEEDTQEDFDEDDSDYGVGSADTDMGTDEDIVTDDDGEDDVSYEDEDEDSEVMDAEEDDIEFTENSDEDGYADIEEDFDLDEEEDVSNTGRVSEAADFMKAVQQQQSAPAHPKKPSAKTTTASASGSTRVTKPVSGSSVAATVENLGGGSDFDIDLDEDFGFGATLSGSKFVPEKG